jgi:tRNA (guanine10-N2)-dimethyltransferase
MRCIFLLSGDFPQMARAEVLALARSKPVDEVRRVLVCDADFRWNRLGLTKKVYRFLFSCSPKLLENCMRDFDWHSVYKKSFSVRVTNLTKSVSPWKESELADFIWDSVEEPKVDLEHSQTPIELIVTDKKVFCGLLLEESGEEFSARRGHLRPENHPTTMSPKIARACVNLTGVDTGHTVFDPFCGTGGILIEAGLMRFKTVGYDIDEEMLKRCQHNLEFFKVKRFSLARRDSTKIDELMDYVVTDLPYGLHSSATDSIDSLYRDFLKVLGKNLKFKAVVMFPHFIDRKGLIEGAGLVAECEFAIPVHSSLTRYVVVIRKKG